ncbi:hypothetical protein Poly41_69790 [Novipirellula artificiosorum]|uniref:Uncharacterized protein n=1 Tax=Novipirellula artificiosorum TaxID=2528016 RepID=A0A5C6CWR1_9BACT|nr:hypothetical protein Poly41_69790 [Novipirellula artificiosorum]
MTLVTIDEADQIQRVGALLGKAALRWRQERKSSEIDSDSLPDRLEFSSVSLLSVTGQNDRAACSVETGSRHETEDTNIVRRTTCQDRDADRRSDPAKQREGCQSDAGHEGNGNRNEERQCDGGQR